MIPVKTIIHHANLTLSIETRLEVLDCFAYFSPHQSDSPGQPLSPLGIRKGPSSEEDSCTVEVCVTSADSIGIGQRVQIGKQAEPLQKVRGAASWSRCRVRKQTMDQPFGCLASPPRLTELLSPAVGALVGF